MSAHIYTDKLRIKADDTPPRSIIANFYILYDQTLLKLKHEIHQVHTLLMSQFDNQ